MQNSVILVVRKTKQKPNEMKTTTTTITTFTSSFLSNLENQIFMTTMDGGGWETEWELLKDQDGNTFDDLKEAIEFIRSGNNAWGIGLSTLKQAQRENAEWNNL